MCAVLYGVLGTGVLEPVLSIQQREARSSHAPKRTRFNSMERQVRQLRFGEGGEGTFWWAFPEVRRGPMLKQTGRG